jgi:hypothetical protein
VLRPDDNRRTIKYCTVRANLLFKTIQRVLIALDFIADEMAIDNSDVGATFPVPQSKFI